MAQYENVAGKIVPVTKADADLPSGPTFAILCGTPGTVNVQDRSGTVRTDVPLQAGYNPLSVIQIRTGGTADDIWALYVVP